VTTTVRVYIEETYGPLGSREQALLIRNRVLFINEILLKMGLGFEDLKTIDCATLEANRHVVRYYDPEERHIVAVEFDDDFCVLSEHYSHLAEWIGEGEYFDISWYAGCPASF